MKNVTGQFTLMAALSFVLGACGAGETQVEAIAGAFEQNTSAIGFNPSVLPTFTNVDAAATKVSGQSCYLRFSACPQNPQLAHSIAKLAIPGSTPEQRRNRCNELSDRGRSSIQEALHSRCGSGAGSVLSFWVPLNRKHDLGTSFAIGQPYVASLTPTAPLPGAFASCSRATNEFVSSVGVSGSVSSSVDASIRAPQGFGAPENVGANQRFTFLGSVSGYSSYSGLGADSSGSFAVNESITLVRSAQGAVSIDFGRGSFNAAECSFTSLPAYTQNQPAPPAPPAPGPVAQVVNLSPRLTNARASGDRFEVTDLSGKIARFSVRANNSWDESCRTMSQNLASRSNQNVGNYALMSIGGGFFNGANNPNFFETQNLNVCIWRKQGQGDLDAYADGIKMLPNGRQRLTLERVILLASERFNHRFAVIDQISASSPNVQQRIFFTHTGDSFPGAMSCLNRIMALRGANLGKSVQIDFAAGAGLPRDAKNNYFITMDTLARATCRTVE